ncbi:membrane-bound PQQ-dependent dehydrogenase, glucose/quinate/shikimate family [Candidatus Pantoea multigeneris]|uniref:Membrane-bound PQQ-dependent dehydrogenase, glucose/quinate/shikimate family n=1 Tax=Candidatus Pantoea multigeneris TaxID=2608357 RepID=A0ABX0RDD7_9GAMM|nr:membrane-bound PQQ-dependent dehydrogenase, glucose/quinate/shikimate family [Pantoea multigeneris]NIF22158.1 membrane-bound PQQ-dependent dehydrogenase, glucose/quinate/shikimate family [Pantoea multigeneris]
MNESASAATQSSRLRSLGLRLFGLLLFLTGIILVVPGYKLLTLHGSAWYVLAGAVWAIAGILVFLRRASGLYLYTLSFIATLVWSLWESGLDGWALVPRLDLPLVYLIFAVLLMPKYHRDGAKGYRRYGIAVLVLTVVGLVVAVPLAQKPWQVEANSTPAGHYYDEQTTPAAQDWPTYGGGYGAQRYSALQQITPANVSQLKRVWEYHTGEAHSANFGNELTPIKVGDAIYGCTIRHKIFAIDAATGKQKWMFDPKTPATSSPPNSACRGVAYYADPAATAGQQCAQRIIVGTLDAKLAAVDANTGAICEDFGDHGFVDLMQGLGKWPAGMVSVTAAPTVVRGVVVTGQQVMDGQLRSAPSGVVRGYDAVTGKLRFAWDMEQPDIATTPPEGKTYTPGTPNMWSTAVADEKLGLVYLPMANSAGDYYSSTRTAEERKYSSSVTALDVTTGKPRWVYQFIRNDVWDYDTPAQPSLVDFPTDKGLVPALIQTTKQGDLWVLDRRTGQPLHKVEEQPAPQGGVEPAERAATQKRSLYSHTQKPDLTEQMMWGISPFDQLACRIQYRSANYQGIFTPPSADKPWIEYPGNNGGSDWGSISVDVHNGVIIENYNDLPSYSKLVPRAVDDALGVFWMGDARYKNPPPGRNRPQAGLPYGQDVNTGWVSNLGVICKQPPFGMIKAIDLTSGKTLWDRPLGTAERNGPWGLHSMLPLQIGLPNNGGVLTTRSGVAFVGATTDDYLRAIDVKSGKTLWKDQLPAGGQETPMTYEVNGQQFVIIMAGGHHGMMTPEGDSVIAYALPNKS